ncbi:hypothetical protein A0H81_05910 [Grifola frondosa]|uniref:Uncharacterized protein n=1 Tax=Grifola frondosa TaxID=5627 RepID=A0A1C7MAE0_GRIFR|nr:hypothetical protein A0H81_05910 [Grifola frondosa]
MDSRSTADLFASLPIDKRAPFVERAVNIAEAAVLVLSAMVLMDEVCEENGKRLATAIDILRADGNEMRLGAINQWLEVAGRAFADVYHEDWEGWAGDFMRCPDPSSALEAELWHHLGSGDAESSVGSGGLGLLMLGDEPEAADDDGEAEKGDEDDDEEVDELMEFPRVSLRLNTARPRSLRRRGQRLFLMMRLSRPSERNFVPKALFCLLGSRQMVLSGTFASQGAPES